MRKIHLHCGRYKKDLGLHPDIEFKDLLKQANIEFGRANLTAMKKRDSGKAIRDRDSGKAIRDCSELLKDDHVKVFVKEVCSAVYM